MGANEFVEQGVVKAGPPPVERSAEDVEIVGGMPEKITHYDRLVEDAVAERICDGEGISKDMTARVVVSKAADDVPQLHIFGRNAEAVDAVADGVRSRVREVYRHYIGNRVSPEEEAATIGPVLAQMFENAPPGVKGESTMGDAMRRWLIESGQEPEKAIAEAAESVSAEDAEREIDEGLAGFNERGKEGS